MRAGVYGRRLGLVRLGLAALAVTICIKVVNVGSHNALRSLIANMGAKAVIPSTRSRSVSIPHDRIIYRHRNRIERCFKKLKHFQRFATRYDRRAIHFLGFIHLAAAMLWMI